MGLNAKLAISMTVLTTLVALFALQHSTDNQLTVSDTPVGDTLECGFTQDFQDYLNSNGTILILFRLFNLPIQ